MVCLPRCLPSAYAYGDASAADYAMLTLIFAAVIHVVTYFSLLLTPSSLPPHNTSFAAIMPRHAATLITLTPVSPLLHTDAAAFRLRHFHATCYAIAIFSFDAAIRFSLLLITMMLPLRWLSLLFAFISC